MVIKHGDMFKESDADLILVTSNASITLDGSLVMGRGAALQARERYPGCDMVFGRMVKKYLDEQPQGSNHEPYGYFIHPDIQHPELGIFQVKWAWMAKASLDVIYYSVCALIPLAGAYADKGNTIALNFPGIGAGRLSAEHVLPIINGLPDNVEIWAYRGNKLWEQ